MVSMLHALAEAPVKRPVWFVHGARDGRHHPLAEEVRALGRHGHLRVHIAYSQPRPEDVQGVDYDEPGRLDSRLVTRLVPERDAEYYLCGPTGFLADLNTGLVAAGVPPGQIHVETFGPVG